MSWSIRKSLMVVTAVGALLALSPAVVRAQAGYGSFGTQRQAGMGNGLASGSPQGGYGQTSGFGQQGGYGQTGAFGQSAFGGGTGGSAFGGGAFGQQGGSAFGQAGGAFGQQGAGGFGQQNGLNGQRQFIGRNAQNVQNNFQNQFGSPQQFGQNQGGRLENFNDLRQQRQRGRDQQKAPPPIKVQLRPDFELASTSLMSTPEAHAATQAQLDDVLTTHNLGTPGSAQVQYTAQGVTVLTGTVASAHARALIERLVSLEPGIGSIDNQLVVGGTAAAPAPGNTP